MPFNYVNTGYVFFVLILKKAPFGTIGLGNPYSMTKIFEKAYAMSRQKPLLSSRLIFPVSSSTATVAAMQAHTS